MPKPPIAQSAQAEESASAISLGDRVGLRICLIAHNAFGALSGVPTGHVGGTERQQSSMARWLARRGHSVSIVTWDEGQEQESYEGVRLIKLCRRTDGVRGMRFFHPRWTSLYRALREADADIYHYNTGDFVLGQTVWWCRRYKRKCVYSVAVDTDCDPRLPALRALRERVLFRYGLRYADQLTVQTHQQHRMLHNGFGLNSVVIGTPNEVKFDANGAPVEKSPTDSLRVLWAGRFTEQKRLEWLLDIAEQLPSLTFGVVGGPNVESYYAANLMKRAQGIANVKLYGKVPHLRMGDFYQWADVLCCTSEYEGFPNTFIESWSYGVPVVSTFDPDGIIATHGLGGAVETKEDLVEALHFFAAHPVERKRASIATRSYYTANLALDVVMERFETLFLSLV